MTPEELEQDFAELDPLEQMSYRAYLKLGPKRHKGQRMFLPEELPGNLTDEQVAIVEKLNQIVDLTQVQGDIVPVTRDLRVQRSTRYMPAFPRVNSCIKVLYVLRGEWTHEVDDHTYRFRVGDICFLSPNTVYSVAAFDHESIVFHIAVRATLFDTAFYSLVAGQDILSNFFLGIRHGTNPNAYLNYHTGDDEEIARTVCDMYRESRGDQEFRDQMIKGLFVQFLVHLVRRHRPEVGTMRVSPRVQLPLAAQILLYLHDQSRDVTLNGAARHFAYSGAHFSRLIKQQTGLNFVQMMTEIRLHQAGELLKNPGLTVADVMDMVGFENPSHFYRTFKAFFGETPGEWRRRE